MPKVGTYEYPLYDVDFVLERLKKVYDVVREDEIQRSVMAETLGMSERGGAFANIVSSLKILGLVETGRGKVVITELAKIAIYGTDAERESMIAESVTRIDLFREIYEQYGREVTNEQIIAFLRQNANVDVIKARNSALKISKIYKKMSKYIKSAETPEQAPRAEPIGVGRRDEIIPPTKVSSPPLKIQYGEVYIQIPPNDLEAIALAKQALEFMENIIRKQMEQKSEQEN